jgi:hypothetical protein
MNKMDAARLHVNLKGNIYNNECPEDTASPASDPHA